MQALHLLRDALYNTHPTSGASPEYARGIVLGIVSTLMAQGKSYTEAIEVIKGSLPINYNIDALPKAWQVDIVS